MGYKLFIELKLVLVSVLFIHSSAVLAQALTPLSYSPARSQQAHQMWHFGEIHAVSASRLIFNSGYVDLGLLNARSGEYLRQLDTLPLYQFAQEYIDTSSRIALQPYKTTRQQQDSISFTRYSMFECMLPIPESTDLLVQASVTYRPEPSELYPWGEVQMIVRIDSALNILSVKELVHHWEPWQAARIDSIPFRRMIALRSDQELIFQEPLSEGSDTILRQYSLVEDQYITGDPVEPSILLNSDISFDFNRQVNITLFNRKAPTADSFFMASPFGKTLSLDTLQASELAGHRFFCAAPVLGTNEVVILSGEPDTRGYVASKTLSIFNISTKKYELLGTYEKATTKAYNVHVLDGIVYVLLYDDRKNRPLLHKVALEEVRVFGM